MTYNSAVLAQLVAVNSRVNLLRSTTYVVFQLTEATGLVSPIGPGRLRIPKGRGLRQSSAASQINLHTVTWL